MKRFILTGLGILLTAGSSISADELNDNASYALMQDCLADAEQSYNQNSGLDHYCINSYLATRPQTDAAND